MDGVGGNFVLPGDIEDASETAHVGSVKLSFLSSAKGPGLTTVYRYIHGTSSVDLDLGMFRQPVVDVSRENLRSLIPDTQSWMTYS